MYKRSLIVSLVIAFAVWLVPSFLSADETAPDEPTFMSLTRRPTPVEKLPSNITVISHEEIEQSGAQTLDQVLDQVVSIHVSQSGSVGSFASMRMRGTPSTAQQQVFIDDQPYGGVSADQIVDLSQISVAYIDHIEIVRGGSSVLFGANTTGGVVHIITKKHPKGSKELGLSYTGGSFNTHAAQVTAGASAGNTDGSVIGSFLNTDGFQENSDANNKSGTITIGQSFGSGGRLSLQTTATNNNVGVPQGTAIPMSDWDGHKERAAPNPTNESDQHRVEGRLKYEQSVGTNGFFQSTFFGSDTNYRNHHGAGAFDTPYEKNTHVLGNDTRLALDQGTTIGATYERDEYKDQSLSLLHVTDVGAYLEQQMNAGRLTFIPALRYDHHSNFGSEYNPRVTTVYQATDFWAVSANASRSFRAPSFFDLYGDYAPTGFVANRNLKPESAWTYDFGNAFKVGSNQTYKVTGFYTQMKDRIAHVDPDNDGALNDTNANVSRAELMGVEFELEGKFGPFFQRGNYTYQRAKENSATKSQYVDIALTPAHMANYTLGWEGHVGPVITTTWQYFSHLYEFDDRSGRKLPSYGLWHARVSQKIKMVELFAGINNILDKRYAESFDFDTVNFVNTIDPMPSRNYYGGASLYFGGVEN